MKCVCGRTTRDPVYIKGLLNLELARAQDNVFRDQVPETFEMADPEIAHFTAPLLAAGPEDITLCPLPDGRTEIQVSVTKKC